MIRQKVLASIVLHADETEVRLLKPGHGKTIAGYLSGYAGDADHPFVFHDFMEETRGYVVEAPPSRSAPSRSLATGRSYEWRNARWAGW